MHVIFNMLDSSNGWERLGKFYAMFSNHASMHPKSELGRGGGCRWKLEVKGETTVILARNT